MSPEFINALGVGLEILVTVFGAMVFALWAGTIIWTVNDMRSRSWDWAAVILATILVAMVPFAGLVVYLLVRPRESLADAYDRALEEEALLRDMGVTFLCPQCSLQVREDWIFCPECQAQLQSVCSYCNQNIRIDWKACAYCGRANSTDATESVSASVLPMDAYQPVQTPRQGDVHTVPAQSISDPSP